jgi:hypothetical protein
LSAVIDRRYSHSVARSIFLRGLALIYLIAFASLMPQLSGLIGSHGILPAHDFLEGVRSDYGSSAYVQLPTLAWVNSSDAFLFAMVWSGIVLAILLFIGILPLPSTIALYLLYLSIDTIGQTFYSFQWDALLLEVGFAAILVAPWGLRSKYSTPPSRVAVWVFRFLIFRLMLESGAVKLLSGDTAWRGLTALTYHYETQPLPTPLAWYAHHLPAIFQKVSVLGVFAVELIVPFFFFAPRRLRIIAASIAIVFQLLIAFTGNYTFFNLLTILLCLFLFEGMKPERTPWVPAVVGVLLIAIGALQILTMFGIPRNLPEPLASINFRAETFRVVNHYGLFAIMTTSRSEIVIEGSDDGAQWKPYEFKYKPGEVHRRLSWVAPYQPRLDWQMWFAVLGNYQQNPWFEQLMLRLLQGSPEVTGLLSSNPFPEKPPHFIRAVVYGYHFSDFAERRSTGAIWTRTPIGDYFPSVSLRK